MPRVRAAAPSIADRRLVAQRFFDKRPLSPAGLVAWFGAVQAQDYAGASWALGQRAPGTTRADVDAALTSGAILRTHVLRPTWHFVAPADIRWMLALTAPRVERILAPYDRSLEIDATLLRRTRTVLTKLLRGQQLTRAEIGTGLALAGIAAKGQRLGHLVSHAELDALICSGGLRGKQFTYALLEERAPPAATLTRDESLGALARRYFTSHGPATLADFAWWSGLTQADGRRAVEIAGAHFTQETIGERTYWFGDVPPGVRPTGPLVRLTPNYDELFIAYEHRDAALHPRFTGPAPGGNILFAHLVTLDGQFIGGWKRTIGAKKATVAVQLAAPVSASERRALAQAARSYAAFLGLPVLVQGLPSE